MSSEKRYIIAPQGLQVGSILNSGKKATPELGNALYLEDIPLGTIIHNIELYPGQGGILAKCWFLWSVKCKRW